jgi:hypothetical protein
MSNKQKEVDQRLDAVDLRFEVIERRLDFLEKRVFKYDYASGHNGKMIQWNKPLTEEISELKDAIMKINSRLPWYKRIFKTYKEKK